MKSVRERPILFSAPMVRALLAGTKTVTRRIVNPKLHILLGGDDEGTVISQSDPQFGAEATTWSTSPYGRAGDRLWVRETHAREGQLIAYEADGWAGAVCSDDGGDWLRLPHGFVSTTGEDSRRRGDYDKLGARFGLGRFGGKWKPSIFMPRWASRITLEVASVRVERLQDITEDDARREGVPRDTEPCDHTRLSCEEIGCMGPTHRSSFAELWMTINGDDSWDANPFVWVIEFKRLADHSQEVAG